MTYTIKYKLNDGTKYGAKTKTDVIKGQTLEQIKNRLACLKSIEVLTINEG